MFVLTLAVLAGLVAIVTGLAVTNRESAHAEWNRMQERRARLAAESAVQVAISVLQTQNPAIATGTDPWATLGGGGSTQFSFSPVAGATASGASTPATGDAYRLMIIDSNSLININTAEGAQLKKLPLTDVQVDSLLDWRNSEKIARPQGAKDAFYNGLDKPYNAKLLPFYRTDELLLVRDFTANTLYGAPSSASGATSAANLTLDDILTTESVSADMNPTGQAKIDINSASYDQLVAVGVSPQVAGAVLQARGGSFSKLGDVFTIPQMTNNDAKIIADNCTFGQTASHTGLINVNTASEAVLNTVPNLTSDAVAGILGRRDSGIHSLGDLVDIPGMTMTILSNTIDRFCVGSHSFHVRAVGVAGTTKVALEADLAIGDDGQVRIRRMKTEPYWSVKKRWNWPETPTQTLPAVGS